LELDDLLGEVFLQELLIRQAEELVQINANTLLEVLQILLVRLLLLLAEIQLLLERLEVLHFYGVLLDSVPKFLLHNLVLLFRDAQYFPDAFGLLDELLDLRL